MFQASAPGSLIIMGEYAVLHGHLALSAAIDKRITVSITPRGDTTVKIDSNLGEYEYDVQSPIVQTPFEFIIACIKLLGLKTGCDIKIESEFSHTQGLGSSAAVTVAMLTALYAWQTKPFDKIALLEDAIKIIRTVKGKGSGADAAASIYGGIACFQFETVIETLLNLPEINVIFSGEKTTTPDAISLFSSNFIDKPNALALQLADLGFLSATAKTCIKNKDWPSLGILFNKAQSRLEKLGVSNDSIDHIMKTLDTDSNIIGRKISGAGLGDCVIALGKTENKELDILPIKLSLIGTQIM